MRKFLTKLSIKFFEFIYKIQKEHTNIRTNKLNKKMLSGSICGEKHHTTSSATLTIKNNQEQDFKRNQEKIKKIFENLMDEPKKILEYIEKTKTNVYVNKNAKKILALINEEIGFILPKKGLKALYLNLILNKKIGFSTNEMFVINSYDISIYTLCYQFYNWYCYKVKIKGYENDTQEKFKHIFEYFKTNKINSLPYEEILKLKSAVKRDIEAIDFVINFAKNKTLAKESLENIKLGKKVRV